MADFQVFRKEIIIPAFLELLKKYEDRIQAAYYDALMEIQGAMKIIYDKYAGTQLKIVEEEYLILKNTDILAVVEK